MVIGIKIVQFDLAFLVLFFYVGANEYKVKFQ